MKVAIVGGTGYVGSYVCDELIKKNHTPKILVREGSESKVIDSKKCEMVNGDAFDEQSLKTLLEGSDAAIYLVAVIREFPKEGITNDKLQFRGSELFAKICSEMGIKRFLLMSALGANADPDASNYQKAKHLSAGQLECFSEENMYYSDRETQDYLQGSSIMDNYRGTNDWD